MSSLAIKDLIARYEMELSKLAFQTAKTEQTVAELRDALRDVAQREEESRRAHLNGDSSSADHMAVGMEEAAPEPAQSVADAGSRDAESDEGASKKRSRRPRLKATPPKPTSEVTPERSSDDPAPKRKRGRKPAKGANKKAKASTGGKGNKGDRSSGYRLSPTDELVFKALEDNGKVLITTEIQDYVENAYRDQGDEKSGEEVRLLISRSLQKLANRRNDLIKVPYEGRGYAYARPEWVNKDGELKRKFTR